MSQSDCVIADVFSPAITLSPSAARRFARGAVALDHPHANVASALAYHGYVQIDPLNVCGRMHDLILRNRVVDYREGDLIRHLYGDDPATPLAPGARRAFEHYFGVLVALPLEAWPHLVASMRHRASHAHGWAGKLSRAEERLATHILAEIARRGPLTSDDIDHDSRALTAWNSSARMAKTVLEKLFFHGRVLITTRRAFRRVYDLPERVLPATTLAQTLPSGDETKRWSLLMRLRQRRLVPLRKQDVAVVADDVCLVRVEGCSPLFCLRADLPLVDTIASGKNDAEGFAAPRLLAPLDPLIYERPVTRRLWNFDYTWEVYTPVAKRVRGYYALPVLAGLEIVGHVDPKADRARRKLVVVSRRLCRGHATASAVRDLAKFLGLRS